MLAVKNFPVKDLPASLKLLLRMLSADMKAKGGKGLKPREVEIVYGGHTNYLQGEDNPRRERVAINRKAFGVCSLASFAAMVDADSKGAYSYQGDDGEPYYCHMVTCDKAFAVARGYHATKNVEIYLPVSPAVAEQAAQSSGGQLTPEDVSILTDLVV